MALLTKAFETVQEATRPQDPDLLAIRKYALRDVQPDEVWTGAMKLCHDRYDRSHERFTKAYLERFAATLPGKSVLGGHDYTSLPIGRFYGAEVLPDAEGHHLKVSYYLPKDSPLVPQIEMGVLKDVSIGFNAGKRVCDLCTKDWTMGQGECSHWPGQQYDGKLCTLTYCESEAHKAEAMEGSFVWCGCQPGAEATAKTFLSGLTEEQRRYWMLGGVVLSPPTTHREESGMGFKSIEEAEVEIKRLQALPLAAEREAELTKALAEKEPLAKDGATFRQFLKDEILRMAGAIDAADQTKTKTEMYTAILGTMEHASAESLLAVKRGIEADFNARFPSGAGQPKGAPNDDETPPKTKSSPFGRMALGGLR